jgi:hypothetical protein
MESKSLFDDKRLRAIMMASTGLGFACMVASLASLRLSKGATFQFEWHWSILILAAAAFFLNHRLWTAIWQVQDHPSPKAKRRLALRLSALLLVGIGAFLYPILFVDGSYRPDLLIGLITAAAFLSTLGWLLYRLGKGLAEADAIELERQARGSKEL